MAIFPLLANIEAKQHHITVGDLVVLTFRSDQTLVPGSGKGALLEQILVGYRFCPNKALLHSSMNHSRGLRRLCAPLDGPGPDFRWIKEVKVQ